MKGRLHNMLPFRAPAALRVALLSILTAGTDALSQSYCSSENTGSDYSVVTNIYNSNGACHDQCIDSYAFAVVQYQQCWCTNYAPGDTTSLSDCSVSCPGYPDELCGDKDSGYYGYIQLSIAPSGTIGGSSSASSTSAPEPSSTSTPAPSSTTAPSSTEDPETSYVSITVTQSADVSVSYVTPTTSSTPHTTSTVASSPSSTTSLSSSTSLASATPVTQVIVTTISGAAVTQTVTSTPIVAPDSHQDSVPIQRKDGLGAGAIAGIIIGVLAGIALLAVAAFLLWRRRQKQNPEESGAAPKKSLGRNVSVLSKAGLLARTRPSMGERDHDDAFYATSATGPNSVRHSMMFAPGAADGVSPASPLGSSHGSDHSRRTSRPMVYDQRLNPSALFANQEANGSRISMQDQQDYSRPLGVMNPDPRASFESRISRA